jgi:hypothetical protein
MIALSGSSKSMVQIIQLLDERKLCFSLPMNRSESLVLCGFGLLFQIVGMDQTSKLVKDCQKMISAVITLLEKASVRVAPAFRHVVQLLLNSRAERRPPPPAPVSRHNSESSMGAPQESAFRATQKHLKAIAQCFSPSGLKSIKQEKEPRRATVPYVPSLGVHGNHSALSISSIRSEPGLARSEPLGSPMSVRQILSPRKRQAALYRQDTPNLDYLAFDTGPIGAHYNLPSGFNKPEVSSSDWERLLGSLDNGQTNIYDSIYGGPPADALLEMPPLSASSDAHQTWSSGLWNLPVDLGSVVHLTNAAAPQSVLSLSDESLTSGDEFPCDFPSVESSGSAERSYPGIIMPELSPNIGLGALDGNFGL